jgi:hypothetical protein
MNERIKELLEQAGSDSSGKWLSHDHANKLAELIIRECIGIVESLPPGYQDYRNQIEDAFRIACVSEIKHKFEVE